jgi:hypothetical protein
VLCIALDHRWNPESSFVILRAYLDESGTHAGSVATVMGGLLGNAFQWERFDKRFRKLQKKFKFTVFHTKKFKNRDGDFKGWSREKQVALLDAMAETTDGEAFVSGVTFSLDNAEYERDMQRTANFPRKVRIPTKYGLCFLECLKHFVVEAENRQRNGKFPKLHIICESGAANAGDALRIFNEQKQLAERAGYPIMESLVFKDKEGCRPLMIADFLAHTRWLREELGVPVQAHELAPASARFAVTALNYRSGALRETKNRIIEVDVAHKERMAFKIR